MKSILELYNSLHSQIIVLLACGWSLQNFDWSRLKHSHATTIGLNRILKVYQPTYWFLSENSKEFIPYLDYLHDSDTLPVVRPGMIADELNLRALPYLTYTPYRNQFPDEDYINAFRSGCFWTKATVTLGALEFARFLNPKAVLLLGCDLCLSPQGVYYFDPSIHPKRLSTGQQSWISTREVWRTNKNLLRMKHWLERWRESFDLPVFVCSPSPVLQLYDRISLSRFWRIVENGIT